MPEAKNQIPKKAAPKSTNGTPQGTVPNILTMPIMVRNASAHRNSVFYTATDFENAKQINQTVSGIEQRKKGRGMGISAVFGNGRTVWITAESREYLIGNLPAHEDGSAVSYGDVIGKTLTLTLTEDKTSVIVTGMSDPAAEAKSAKK